MKEKLIQSTIILLIGGLITKVLGMLIKIVMARLIGTEGLGYYMLILPTFILLINISQLGLPLALSKLIAEENRSSKKLFLSILPLLIIINIVLMIIIYSTAPIISNYFLHNKDLEISIKSMSLVIPFTSISSICRSYYFGKQKMFPHVLSNIIEDLVRLLIMILGISYILPYGLKYTICFLILSNIISESISTIILIIFLPKNIQIHKKDLVPNKTYIKESLQIGIPTTTSRIISNIAYFLEPIIITTSLLNIGYSSSYITNEYGIISGYIFPMVMMPQFLSGAISSALLPAISKYHAQKNTSQIKRKLYLAIVISLLIGLFFTIIFMIFPDRSLKLMFNEVHGTNYLLIAAPIFLLTYVQGPILSTLQAINNADIVMKSSLIGVIIKSIVLFILLYLDIKMYALLIAIFIQYITITWYQYIKLKKLL